MTSLVCFFVIYKRHLSQSEEALYLLYFIIQFNTFGTATIRHCIQRPMIINTVKSYINPRTSKGGGGGSGSNGPPIGFSDLKFEAFKQSK